MLIGYHDHRVERPTPFGFAMLVDGQILVHHRKDITQFSLPPIFEFTAKNLPAVIHDEFKRAGKEGKRVGDLHKFLVRHCFDGLGSLRCWQPIKETLHQLELDGFVLCLRNMVDQQMGDYAEVLQDYHDSCDPRWQRSPDIQKKPEMPELTTLQPV